MKKVVALILTCMMSLSALADTHYSVQTVTTPAGEVVTTDKPPKVLAVKDSAIGKDYLFVFYRTKFKNQNDKNKEYITYQYAEVNESSDQLVWSDVYKINRDDFRSHEGVQAVFQNDRIYLFGKRNGLRYTSASLKEAMQNRWAPFDYLRTNKGEKLSSKNRFDVAAYEQNGKSYIAIGKRHEEAQGTRDEVKLAECRPVYNDVKSLSCSGESAASGKGFHKHFYTRSSPAVVYATDVFSDNKKSLYVIWPSHVRPADRSTLSDFLYFRRADHLDYYADYHSNNGLRPWTFANAKGKNLYTEKQPLALENNGVIELYLREEKEVHHYRYEGLYENGKVYMKHISIVPVVTKSALTGTTLNDKAYVAYRNAAEDNGGLNAVNVLVVEG